MKWFTYWGMCVRVKFFTTNSWLFMANCDSSKKRVSMSLYRLWILFSENKWKHLSHLFKWKIRRKLFNIILNYLITIAKCYILREYRVTYKVRHQNHILYFEVTNACRMLANYPREYTILVWMLNSIVRWDIW